MTMSEISSAIFDIDKCEYSADDYCPGFPIGFSWEYISVSIEKTPDSEIFDGFYPEDEL